LLGQQGKIANFLTNMSYEVQLEKFNGPLDLLLQLIEEKNLDVTEISLSQVTAGYLSYLSQNEKIEPRDMVEFLVVAATLILIKSKAILPTIDLSLEEKEEIMDLEQRLVLYRLFKTAGQKFKQQLNQPPFLFSREPWTNKVRQFSPPANVDITKLFEAYKGIIEQSKEEAEVLPEAKIKRVITLEERISQLISKLSGGQSFKFSEITSKAEKTEVIITFLAILHLAKEKIISVKQENNFGELFIQSNNIKD